MATTTTSQDPRIDRLYELLPAIYRIRDAEQRYPLQALLRVIAEQVNVVEDDIGQLYENWFIETAEEWAVPYVADLIGYNPVLEAGLPGDEATWEGRELNRLLVPRREVANTIHNRRRKGTLALLEMLASDVAGWPARAVEFFKLLGWNQNINHLHLDRARTIDVRRVEDLDLIGGPFDPLAFSVDVRRINSHRTQGRYNIPSVGIFIWRLKSYPVTHSPAFCAENAGPHCYSFSVLGQDAPLFIKPQPEAEPTHIADEMNVPAAIRRLAFAKHPESYYGQEKSVAIWAEGWGGFDPKKPVPLSAIIPADLSDWQYTPPLKHIAIDPVLGRFAFPPGQLPKKHVRVIYHYGFSADMGGGEYPRQLFDPSPREMETPDPDDPSVKVRKMFEPTFYRVGAHQEFHRIGDALDHWKEEKPWDAVIELTDSSVYVAPIYVSLHEHQTLQIRAASGARPVIRLLDWQTDLPDALSITMARNTRFILDGLIVTGRPVHIHGRKRESPPNPVDPICGAEIVIRHCTLVPGWGLDCDCEPKQPAEPSLELYGIRATLRIEHSILGSIQIHEDEVKIDPIPVYITDSILDATDPAKEAIGAPGWAVAHAFLTIRRCTVFGIIDVHAVQLAENCIFNDCVNVARRQLGCMRFCYVPAGCRTPRRYRCQPDMVAQAVKEKFAAEAPPNTNRAAQAAEIASERQRVRPQFTAIRYGAPAYAQLAFACALEIKRGADDESEMGAFHNLFQPQREANLRARLDEYTPAGMDAGLIFVT
jgi:hypothetical protein